MVYLSVFLCYYMIRKKACLNLFVQCSLSISQGLVKYLINFIKLLPPFYLICLFNVNPIWWLFLHHIFYKQSAQFWFAATYQKIRKNIRLLSKLLSKITNSWNCVVNCNSLCLEIHFPRTKEEPSLKVSFICHLRRKNQSIT